MNTMKTTVLAFLATIALGPGAALWALHERDIPEIRRLASQIENDAGELLDDIRQGGYYLPGRNRGLHRTIRRFIDATADFNDEVGMATTRRSLVNDALSRMNDRADQLRVAIDDPGGTTLVERDWRRIERRLDRLNELYWRRGPGLGRDGDRIYRLWQEIRR